MKDINYCLNIYLDVAVHKSFARLINNFKVSSANFEAIYAGNIARSVMIKAKVLVLIAVCSRVVT